MRVLTKARDEGYEPYSQGISVLLEQDLVSWEREIVRPTIRVGIAEQELCLSMPEVNELRRKLDEVVMDIEEKRLWR